MLSLYLFSFQVCVRTWTFQSYILFSSAQQMKTSLPKMSRVGKNNTENNTSECQALFLQWKLKGSPSPSGRTQISSLDTRNETFSLPSSNSSVTDGLIPVFTVFEPFLFGRLSLWSQREIIAILLCPGRIIFDHDQPDGTILKVLYLLIRDTATDQFVKYM